MSRDHDRPSPSRALRRLCTSALCGPLLLLGPWGCSTGAIAIQQCREIERQRCEGAFACGVIESSEVDSCKRFYNDQCLHGIAGDEEPTADEQTRCLEFLQELQADAEAARDDEDEEALENACQILAEPWDYDQCAFINRQIAEGGAGSKDEDE